MCIRETNQKFNMKLHEKLISVMYVIVVLCRCIYLFVFGQCVLFIRTQSQAFCRAALPYVLVQWSFHELSERS